MTTHGATLVLFALLLCAGADGDDPTDLWLSADAATAKLRYSDAASLRSRALAAGYGGARPVASLSALALDLRNDRQYSASLAVIANATALAASDDVRAVLTAFESDVLTCSGDAHAVEALRAFTRALKLGYSGDSGGGTVTRELSLLRRVLRLGGAAAPPPPVRAAMQSRVERLTAGALAAGPWRTALQLPHSYDPALLARPWHTAAAPWPALLDVERELLLAAGDLRAEYVALRDGGRLLPETECIHEPVWLLAGGGGWRGGGGVAAPTAWAPKEARGGWYVFTANHPSLSPAVDATGYSTLTPAISALVARIYALALPRVRIIRSGYSALWPGALLHPHFGESNAQLKFHLGLLIPKATDGTPCAHLTVGNVTRSWDEDQVLFFDDSFEHSVRYSDDDRGCAGGERVVLQLVIAHPDSAAARGAGAAESELIMARA